MHLINFVDHQQPYINNMHSPLFWPLFLRNFSWGVTPRRWEIGGRSFEVTDPFIFDNSSSAVLHWLLFPVKYRFAKNRYQINSWSYVALRTIELELDSRDEDEISIIVFKNICICKKRKLRHCSRLEIGRKAIEICTFPNRVLVSLLVPSGWFLNPLFDSWISVSQHRDWSSHICVCAALNNAVYIHGMTRSVGPNFDWLCKCAPEYWHALLHFCWHSDGMHYRPIGFLSKHSRTNAPWVLNTNICAYQELHNMHNF